MSLNVALIGYGGMGAWHTDFIKKNIKNLNFKGIWDIRECRRKVAEQNGLFVFESEQDVLNDLDVDLVVLAVPNDFHKPLAIKALKSGKNVVCEKPVMLNAKELEDVISIAEQCNKVFTVHQNRRWDKDFVTAKHIVDNNIIGKPHFIESRVLGSRRVLHGWRGAKNEGGGMLLDWGVHLIDQFMFLDKSPVKSVFAELLTIEQDCEVDDNIKVALEFESGLHALVEVANHCFIPLPRWHISCNDGTAVIDDWNANGNIVKLKYDDEMAWDEVICYTAAGPTRTMAPRPAETIETLQLPIVNTDLTEFYNNIIAAITNGEELLVKPCEALRVMKVIDAAFLSAEKHRSIEVNI